MRANVITRALAETADIYTELVEENASLRKQLCDKEEKDAKNLKEVEKIVDHMKILQERNELMKKEATERELVTRCVKNKLNLCQEANKNLQRVGSEYDNTVRLLLEKLEFAANFIEDQKEELSNKSAVHDLLVKSNQDKDAKIESLEEKVEIGRAHV